MNQPLNRVSLRFVRGTSLLLVLAVCALRCRPEDGAKAQPAPAQDVLVVANGDTLHGKFVKEVGGKVTFHTEAFGDVDIPWNQIKELHTAQIFAVLDKTVKLRGKKHRAPVPEGVLDMQNQAIVIHAPGAAALAPIPVANAQFIVDGPTLNTQMNHEPNFFTGWNGAATAGATLVAATQNQYTVSGAIGLLRVVPSVSWLNTRHRTSGNFSGSYGKITQPAYFSAGVLVPQTVTKSAIYHADAERDQFFSARLFGLAQTAFDHNFAQDLQLQQIYGGGLGWTIFNTPRHEADVKATLQYEKQEFISGAAGTNQNLVGSTFAANYMLHLSRVTYTQSLSYIPAWNTPRAYSTNETNTFAFPTYKSLSFSVGTIDTYLNDPPLAVPPTRRNSFQFTMGLTYAIKSKY